VMLANRRQAVRSSGRSTSRAATTPERR
jgi:hypothetical protein